MFARRVFRRWFYALPHDLRRSLYARLRKSDYETFQALRTSDTPAGYSFRHFDQRRCIFVHVPKTAGVSITRTVFGHLTGSHTTIARYQLIFSKAEFDQYFKFAFVRNPWDRLHSAYQFLRRGGLYDRDRQWAAANLNPYSSFEEFVLRALAKPETLSYTHFVPQHEFLCRPFSPEIGVDFLGRYETLEADFETVKQRLALDPDLALRKDNVSAQDDVDYRDAYTNEMREAVASVYERDIALLGYRFDRD